MVFLLDIASWCLILTGGGFLLTGAIGVLRMPDFYTRLHAAGLTDTMGASFLAAGMLLQSGFNLTAVKLVLIALFVIITSPIATHALINAAYMVKPGMKGDGGHSADKIKGDKS